MDTSKRVKGKLARLKRSIRTMFVAHGLAKLLLAAALLLIWHFLTDTFFELPLALRAISLILMGIAILAVFLRTTVYPLTKRMNTEDMALLVEKEFPLLKDRLISALQMERERERYKQVAKNEMVDSVIDEGFEVAARLDFKEVVQTGRLILATGVTAGVILVFVLMMVFNQADATIWAKRLFLAEVDYPRKTTLDIRVPNEAQVAEFPSTDVLDLNLVYDSVGRVVSAARGTSVRIIALPQGEKPETAEIRLSSGGDSRRVPMNVAYGEDGEVQYYHFNIPSVLFEEQEIWIEAGDAEEGPLMVKAVQAPSVKNVHIEYVFPPYMERGSEVQQTSRGLRAPEGTKAVIHFETDRELNVARSSLRFSISGSDPVEVQPEVVGDGGTSFRVERVIDNTTSEYEISIIDRKGLHNTERYRYPVRAQADQPPEVKLDFYGRGLEDESRVPVTMRGVIPLRYTMNDRFGIKRRALRYRLPEISQEWIEYHDFSSAHDQRDGLFDSADEVIRTLEGILSDSKVSLDRSQNIDAGEVSGRIITQSDELGKKISQLMNLSDTLLRPQGDELPRALNVVVEAHAVYRNKFAVIVSAESLQGEAGKLASVMEFGLEKLRALHVQLQAYRLLLRTNATEEYRLHIADLMSATSYRSEADIRDFARQGGSSSVAVEVRMEAEDFNIQRESGKGGVGTSAIANYELMTVDDLTSQISRYIRNSLREEINLIDDSQRKILKEMQDFIAKQRRLSLGDSEEDRLSKRILTTAQLQQGGLPDGALRLARRFGHVAQAYIFNELEEGYNDKPQENAIQAVRIMLHLLTSPLEKETELTKSLKETTSSDSEERREAIETILQTLDLRSGMIGVRRSFSNEGFAQIIAGSKFRESCSLPRLDLQYRELLNPDSSSDRRRAELDAIILSQEQALAGLKVAMERLKKWEGFDAILSKWKTLVEEQRELAEKIKRLEQPNKPSNE